MTESSSLELGSPSPLSSLSPNPTATLVLVTTAASDLEPGARPRRKPIPKKGHTKSRRGCYNCKRRKVKCQETLPECANCRRLGLGCVYSEVLPPPRDPSPSAALQSTPAVVLTMEDLRYFHHFLVTAYPPLPMRGDAIWQSVAALSHSVSALRETLLTHTSPTPPPPPLPPCFSLLLFPDLSRSMITWCTPC